MIVVDVEGTGLDSRKSSIVSIGAVDVNNPSNQFYQECRMFEGAVVLSEALAVNGFTMEQITDPSKQSLEELMKNFIEWATSPSIKNRTLVGQNVGVYDYPFLFESVKRSSLKWPFGHRAVDLHSVCVSHLNIRGLEIPLTQEGTSAVNSPFIFTYAGLFEEPKPHNALTGAKMAAETFYRINYGKKLLPDFKDFEVPSYLAS